MQRAHAMDLQNVINVINFAIQMNACSNAKVMRRRRSSISNVSRLLHQIDVYSRRVNETTSIIDGKRIYNGKPLLQRSFSFFFTILG